MATVCVARLHQFAAACHLNIEISDFLAQGISIDPQQIGAFGLISACCIQRNLDQRGLALAQDPRRKTGRR